MNKTIYLIYSPSVAVKLTQVTEHSLVVEKGIQIRKVKLIDLPALHCQEYSNHALLWVEQREYPQALAIAREKNLSLGFLPIAGDSPSQFFKNLDLPGDLDSCLQIALQEEHLAIDMIICNGEVVTDGVNLENQTTMTEFFGDRRDLRGFARLSFAIRRFVHAFSLTPHPVTLTTAKGKRVATAVTGMVLLDFHSNGFLFKLFGESISLRDHRVSLALFAPESILSYLQLSSVLWMAIQKGKLPSQVGYIRSETLTVKSPVDTHFLVNGCLVTTRELRIETLGEAINVYAGEKFRERQCFRDDKENVTCDQLPQQEDRVRYLSKALPFFSHALESDFKELFLLLKENAGTSNSFVLLMVLSALLASLGLFLNSPSVVIGAMVLAPLMAPIISLSMGLLRSDIDLSRRSFFTLLIGIFIAMSLSASMAFLLPFHDVTGEIEGRLHPSTLDLLVAVISGVAGAYAHARENIAKSLPGVAIAVALVPPLCVSGIGLGWQDLHVFSGAMLLFLTNLTGILMAAGLSFLVIGFAPFSRAKKGIFISASMVAVISVPLYFSFADMREIAELKQRLISQEFRIDGGRQQLRNVKVRLGDPLKISGDLVTPRPPDPHLLASLENRLSKQMGKPVVVELNIRLVSDRYFH